MALDFGMLYTDSKLKNTPSQNETQNYCTLLHIINAGENL